jgi:hypothetical protein
MTRLRHPVDGMPSPAALKQSLETEVVSVLGYTEPGLATWVNDGLIGVSIRPMETRVIIRGSVYISPAMDVRQGQPVIAFDDGKLGAGRAGKGRRLVKGARWGSTAKAWSIALLHLSGIGANKRTPKVAKKGPRRRAAGSPGR